MDNESERTLKHASDDADSPVAATSRGAQKPADQGGLGTQKPADQAGLGAAGDQAELRAAGDQAASDVAGAPETSSTDPISEDAAAASPDGQMFGMVSESSSAGAEAENAAEAASKMNERADNLGAYNALADREGADAHEGLKRAVVEIERSAAALGWDHASTVYALVPTKELLAIEELPADMRAGLEAGWDGGENTLTAVIQEDLPGEELEDTLAQLGWPESVVGAAVATERVMVPPEVQAQAPEDPKEAIEFFANHPQHDEVRIVAGVLRTGEAWCTLRTRSHDHDDEVAGGVNLVPGLIDALYTTFLPAEERLSGGCGCGGSGCGCGSGSGSGSGSDGCGSGSGSGGCGSGSGAGSGAGSGGCGSGSGAGSGGCGCGH